VGLSGRGTRSDPFESGFRHGLTQYVAKLTNQNPYQSWSSSVRAISATDEESFYDALVWIWNFLSEEHGIELAHKAALAPAEAHVVDGPVLTDRLAPAPQRKAS
jgi:hypothetical protein